MSQAVREAALCAHRAGLCVFPPKENGSKAPDTDEWASRQTRRTTEEEVDNFYSNGRTGLGVITGAVSGGLELLDFDEHEVFSAFRERAEACGLGDLVQRISDGYTEETPRGTHLFYRCAQTKCTKLARRPKLAEERKHPGDRIQVKIETKGEGGFAVIAPSHGAVHETRRPYVLVQGGPESIVTITPAEREALHDLARSFDEMPPKELSAQAEPKPGDGGHANGTLRPGDDFNARTTWREILEPRGWRPLFERGGEAYWQRPGKTEGLSATTNYRGSDLLYCFSTSTDFEAERGYDKFGALAVLEHGGDLAQAARALAARGFGSTSPPSGRMRDRADFQVDDEEVRRAPAIELERISFSGDSLLALLKRDAPLPIEAARPTPGHFSTLIAPPITGKTSLSLWNAMARAAGVAPWDGVEARPAGRVLIYTLDEAPEQVVRRLNSLSLFHPAGPLKQYAANLVVVGPDRELDHEALDRLRFDAQGLATLERFLTEAEAAGEPFAEVYVDAYADVIPLGETENSNEEATRIGGALERLAVRFGCAIVLLHHVGKPAKEASATGELPDLRYLGRGASALAAKARVVTSLEMVGGMPHLRRVRTATNLGRTPKPILFQVCSNESTEEEELIFFRLAEDLGARDPSEVLQKGETITTTELARRLAGEKLTEGAEPPGDLKRLATRLRIAWQQSGKVVVADGKHGAKTLTLVESEASVA